MAQERVPGLERDGAVLSAAEQAAVTAIARRMSDDDPAYARRLSHLGGYEINPLGLPSKWAAFPVAVVGALLALGVLFAAVVMDSGAAERAKGTDGVVHHLPK
ncbi:hypothetical protein [Actinocorallia longicatena]|uniref:DUF3040 domain-containing protein n=1 Tax=Actinocorallia longicatena TaxID=111803 RepID=A0ABP6QP42_9ACTN